MKKKLGLMALFMAVLLILAGCNGGGGDAQDKDAADSSGNAITVISREEGSGTRGAFIELMGIEEKNDSGEKVDNTTDEAEISNSTSVMMTTVAGNPDAIGYISLGSLNDTVKAVKIDGVEATKENINNGTYKIARPFHIATKGDVSPLAEDFIAFMMSEEGQKIAVDNGYVSKENKGAYEAKNPEGKLVIAGSSSISPLMEKLIEAYKGFNANADIQLQQNDSTTGMTSVMEGIADIGMASRDLKDTELSEGLEPTVIAMDGIAVIVNNDNSIEDLSSDDVKAIFTGEKTSW
ncbi:MAG: phosphate ABC transporter substrate-binding protein [Eubacteriaceae bacterium]|jgi:phosphate transport system substrate-binding protein|nr:phosphate ABC transporter substrate-binding protein [Eubacteriaceae bacterium]